MLHYSHMKSLIFTLDVVILKQERRLHVILHSSSVIARRVHASYDEENCSDVSEACAVCTVKPSDQAC